jgi:hypothetical protein
MINTNLSALDVKVKKSQLKPTLQLISIDPSVPTQSVTKLKKYDTSSYPEASIIQKEGEISE